MDRLAAFAFVALAVGATAPQAATVSVAAHQTFAVGAGAAARTAQDGYAATGTVLREETFEQAAIDTATNRYVSPTVGTFQGLGGIGSGGSNVPIADQIQIRQTPPTVFGRQNLTPNGKFHLDSNDTRGWSLTLDAASLGLAYFTDISFLLMDAGDQGATFELKLDGNALKTIKGRPDGSIDFIALSFAHPTTTAVLNFANTVQLNDGFGLDQVRVYGEVAPIPLPPAMLMLGSALLGLGMVRRRKARA